MKLTAWNGRSVILRKGWLIMRIMTVMILATVLHVSAHTSAQNITINTDNIPVSRLFQKLNKATGYSFLIKDAIVSPDRKVSVHVTNGTLQQVLEQVLRPLSLTYDIDNKIVFIVKAAPPKLQEPIQMPEPQEGIDVKGHVMDSTGLALPGASILIKGTQRGAKSNNKGEFELKDVPEGATIVVSYAGYEPREITVKKGYNSLVAMLVPTRNSLDQMIVQAYGTTTKRLSTGSLSTVKSDELEKQPVGNVISALEGLVPGLQITQQTGVPGGNFRINLRGQNSLLQNSDPLYVVDGIPYSASSLSQIGDRSPLGNTGVSPLNGLNMFDIESITVLKDAAATSIYGARGANGVILITLKKGRRGMTKVDVNAYSGWGKDPRRMKVMNTTQYLALRREAFKNGATVPTATTAPDLLVWDSTRNKNWQNYLLGGTAHYNDLQASVSGGTGNTGFLFGGGYHEEGTVFPGNSADKKGSVRFNLNHTSTDGRFKALLSGSFLHEALNLPLTDLTYQSYLPPNQPELFNPDGSLNFPSGGVNPLTGLRQPYSLSSDNLVTNASLGYYILPGLQAKVDMGYTDIRSKEVQINPLSSYNPANLATVKSSSNFGDNEYKIWNIEPQISYNHRWQKHAFSALVGSTIQSVFRTGKRITANDFPNDALLTNIQAAKTLTISNNTDANTKDNSLFGRFTYNYDERYLVDVTARRDGSSRFGPGKQFGNFGAAGIGWVFSKEKFIANNQNFLSFGKLRASYGTVGNAPGVDYKYLSLWNVTTYPYDTTTNLYPTNLFNPNYAWEVTHKMEAGIEMEFFKGRVNITADYYRNRSSNQLVNYTLPAITGFTGIIANLPATVLNTGWEFTLQTVNIRTPKFQWTSNFSFSAPRNKLASFPNLDKSSYATTFILGQPIYNSRLFHYVDVDPKTGIYRFQTKSGPSSSPAFVTDYYTNYDSRPRYWGGLDNNFSYKSITLSFFVYYAKQKGMNLVAGTPGNMSNFPANYVNHWRQPGDISNIQKVSYPGFDLTFPNLYQTLSDYSVSDASFIRLKNLAVSYQLPAKWLSKARFSNGRIYLQCQNLFTITSFKGLDPETQSNTVLPPLRVITAGIQFTL